MYARSGYDPPAAQASGSARRVVGPTFDTVSRKIPMSITLPDPLGTTRTDLPHCSKMTYAPQLASADAKLTTTNALCD